MSLEQINLSASLSGTTTATSAQEVPASGPSDLAKPARPVVRAVAYRGSKRATDIVLCVGGLILFWPVMGAIAVAIKIDSRGPILFKQSRPGLGGRPFYCLKFRTMIADAESLLQDHPELINEFAQNGKIRQDPRVTRMGHFLRKTSLDELPQILNILYGQMTLVGPRPIVWSQEEQYGEHLPKLYSVKPGLAGLWQVEGRSETTMDERIVLDMKYVDSRTLRGDMKLLLRTLRAVIQRKGAY